MITAFLLKPKKKPTCTTTGRGWYECSICHARKAGDIPAGHNFTVEKEIVLAPTCTSRGIIRYQCENCTETKKINVDKLAHVSQNVSKKPATCAEAGYQKGTKCKMCGVTLSGMEVIPATGEHVYEFASMITDATCTEARVNLYKCKTCTATKEGTTGAALGHTYPEHGTITREPTCLKAGQEKFKCIRCTKTKIESIDKLEHSWQGLSEVPATCTEDGKTAGTWCWKCGTVKNGMETIPATGVHNYTVHVKMVHDATCTEKRVDIKKCATCEKTQEVSSGGLLPHTVVGYAEVPATCITDGVTAGSKCRICNTVITGMETIPATGEHDYVFVSMVHDATCQEPRLNNYKCRHCDATKQGTTGGLLPCNIVETEAVAPTCLNKGKTAGTKCTTCRGADGKYTCAYCQKNMVPQQYIDALGHDVQLRDTYKEPTCKKEGNGWYNCTRCGYGYEAAIPKLEHIEVVEVFREATCTQTGCKKTTCGQKGCGLYKLEEIPVLDHNEVTLEAVPATCTATGLTEGKQCSACNKILLAQTVTPITDHEFTVTVPGKPVTCTEDGYTEHKKCAHCDATQGKEEIDTDGHVFVKYICTVCGQRDGSCEHKNRVMKYTAPTCTDAGSQSFWCPDCNYESMEILDKIAHSYSGGKCSGCGAIDPDSICNHTNGYTTDTEGATCTQSGSIITRCGDCGAVVDRVILPATGHNHVNGICTACGHKDNNRFTYDFQDVHVVGGTSY